MKTILSLVLSVVFCTLYANCITALMLDEKTNTYTQVGCFKDKDSPLRALPILVANFRLREIDWSDMSKTVKKCADAVKARDARPNSSLEMFDKPYEGKVACTWQRRLFIFRWTSGYKWFGVQFYGECWSGPDSWLTYSKYGTSTNCWKGVGKHWTNMVYKIEEGGITGGNTIN